MRPVLWVLLAAIALPQAARCQDADSGSADKAPAAAAESPSGPPLDIYPGSKSSPAKAQEYLEERGLDKAWAYVVKAPFAKVVKFYKGNISEEAVASSESDDLYFASYPTYEMRIEKGQKGQVILLVGRKPKSSGGDGAAGAAQTPAAPPQDSPPERLLPQQEYTGTPR
jgi:hypothetical protein